MFHSIIYSLKLIFKISCAKWYLIPWNWSIQSDDAIYCWKVLLFSLFFVAYFHLHFGKKNTLVILYRLPWLKWYLFLQLVPYFVGASLISYFFVNWLINWNWSWLFKFGQEYLIMLLISKTSKGSRRIISYAYI